MSARALLLLCALPACGEPLPADIEGYQSRCVRLNADPIPPYPHDPHAGWKNVYACNADPAALRANVRPFADGVIIVKDSTREGEDHRWLVATARKEQGAWRWDEYTRNFSDEPFRRGLGGQSVCTRCHREAEAADWIFTTWTAP